MTLNRKALWPWLIIWLMHLFAKTLHTSMMLWRCNDVRKFETNAILFREIQCKKRDILIGLLRVSEYSDIRGPE